MPSWITSNYLWEPPIYVIEPRNLSTFMEINWAFQSVSWEQFHWYIDKNNKHIHFQKLFLEFHFIEYFHFFPITAEIFRLKWLLVSGNTYHFQWNFLEKQLQQFRKGYFQNVKKWTFLSSGTTCWKFLTIKETIHWKFAHSPTKFNLDPWLRNKCLWVRRYFFLIGKFLSQKIKETKTLSREEIEMLWLKFISKGNKFTVNFIRFYRKY